MKITDFRFMNIEIFDFDDGLLLEESFNCATLGKNFYNIIDCHLMLKNFFDTFFANKENKGFVGVATIITHPNDYTEHKLDIKFFDDCGCINRITLFPFKRCLEHKIKEELLRLKFKIL